MNYNDIIDKVSKEVKLPTDIIDKTYKGFWQFIKTSVQDLPLKEDLSEEEFNKLRTSFNIPSLGKLACTYSKYKKVKEKFNYINKIKGRNEEAN